MIQMELSRKEIQMELDLRGSEVVAKQVPDSLGIKYAANLKESSKVAAKAMCVMGHLVSIRTPRWKRMSLGLNP